MISQHTSFQDNHQDETPNLYQLGWTSFFQQQLKSTDKKATPARVVGVRRNCFFVSQGQGQRQVTLAGSLIIDERGWYPAVGDWVLLQDSVIFSILSRQNALIRKASGGRKRKNNKASPQDQVFAANIDTTFIVCGLDRDFNLRRIERYLALIYNCSITPEIILTKADLSDSPDIYLREVESVAPGVPIHLVSAKDEESITHLKCDRIPGKTVALIGSSGAGKSTLINRLYGEEIRTTSTVSKGLGKGTHTTTNRDLIILPSGGMIIDNPGIREVGLAVGCSVKESAFPEINELSRSCKFQDCSHTHEPGCYVQKAVATGKITAGRLNSYHKIMRELDYFSHRETKGAARIEKEQWKAVSQKRKKIKKMKKS